MEMRHLNYFYTVSQFENFTHAAQQLHVSQPAITNTIQQLEEELGVKLFSRNSKHVSLTFHGKLFLKRVESILSDIHDSIHEVKELNGKIKLGLPPMIGSRIFPDIYVEFKKIYPGIMIEVIEEGSLRTSDRVEKGELDLGLVILPKESDGLATVPLMDEEIMLCVSPNHQLSREEKVNFSSLKDENFILLTDDFIHRKITQDQCEKNGFNPKIAFETNKVDTAKALVAKGLGISLFMKLMVAKQTDIVQLPFDHRIKINIGLVWKKNRHLSSNCKKFIHFSENFFCGASVS